MFKNYKALRADRDVFLKNENSMPFSVGSKTTKMKWLSGLLLLCCMLFTGLTANAQFSGTTVTMNGSPVAGSPFASLSAAITAVNGLTITGPVVVTCGTGTETSPAGGYSITATGTAANTIIIQGNGAANSVITAPAPAGTAGNLNDAIFKIIGGDYITIQGFAMNENAANTVTTAASNTMVEWGVALLYASTTNGAQNCTIQNNTITLNRTYQNTFGIYSNSTHSATTITTSATATTTAGGNSGLKIYSNTITNVNNGIVVIGPTAIADVNTGVEIGGSGLGNTITNYGTTGTFSGYVNMSGTTNGVLVRNCNGYIISHNTISSSNGGVTSGTLNGIQQTASTSAPTATFTNTINNNSISLRSGLAGGAVNGILVASGSASATSTQNINNNDFNNFSHTVAASGTITFISTSSTHQFTNINSNTFTGITVNTTGSVNFIAANFTRPANAVTNVNNNSIVTSFTKTGVGGTVNFYNSNSTSPTTVTETNSGNNFSNITLTGATTVSGWISTDGSTTSPFGPSKTVTNNTFSNITTGASTVTLLSVGYSNSGSTTNNVSGNTISNVAGASSITGIASAQGAQNFFNNTISGLTTTGGNTVSGISISGGSTQNVYSNVISNLEANNASGAVNGILVSSGATTTLYNNRIGDLRTPIANASNPLVGINITGGTTVNAYYNTVHISASSTGALFGSSAISVSSTPTVTLRNNIFSNVSTTAGAGLAVAHRRSSTTLTSYAAASNNNLFFTNSSYYTDGTNTDATFAAYKTRVASRDASSVSENVTSTFLSTTSGNANFLKMNTAVATQVESGGAAISGITTDFEGDTRNASTPDIGADEFAGTGIDLSAPSISYTALGNSIATSTRSFNNVTMSDASGINGTAGTSPRVYYKKSTDANDLTGWKYVEATGSSPFSFTIDHTLLNAGSVTAGDVIQYFVVAQDVAGTPNVGINSGIFNAAPTSVALTSGAFPITGTINSYTITPSIAGTKTVCPSGCDYATLTVAGGAFEAINNATVSANVVLQITGDLTAETGAVKLNEFASPYTVTIKPSGSARTISGTTTGSLLGFNGADRVIIDGSLSSTSNTVCPASSASRDLTISNTNTGTSSAVVWFQTNGANGATNNTVMNCNIVGNASTTTLVGIGSGSSTISSSSLGTGNNNNSFVNNNITKVQIGIYSQGASAANKNTGTIINQNQINGTVASSNNVRIAGIFVGFENNITISGNNIANVSGSSGDGFAIACGSIGISTTAFTGNEVINATVTNNVIDNIRAASTFSVSGIYFVTSTNSGTNLIANNAIANTSINGTSGDFGSGIFVGGGAVSTNVYHNTVFMSGTATGGSQPNFALAIGGSNPAVNVRNNIFMNSAVTGGGTGLGVGAYAVGVGYSTFTNLVSNNNNYFTSGTEAKFAKTGSLATGSGTDVASLAAYQTAIGQDGASLNTNTVFTSATDLRPDSLNAANVTLSTAGADLTAVVASDIDCGTRTATPSLGFKQFAVAGCTAASGGTISPATQSKCVGQTVSMTSTGFDSGSGISYQWEVSSTSGSGFANVTGGTGATTTSYTSAALTAGTYYFRLKVTCTPASATGYSNELVVTVYPNPTASASSNSPACIGGTLNLTGTTDVGTSFTWTGPNSFASTNQNPSISSLTAAAAGTYSFTATANGCSSTVATTVVAVNTTPVAPTTSGYNVCLNGSVPVGQGLTASTTSTLTGSQTLSFNVTAQPTETLVAPGTTVASATMNALPAGATITSVVINYPGLVALSSSWRADIRLGLGGAIVNAAAADPSAANSAGTLNYTRTATTGITSTNTGGTVNLLYWDNVDDNTSGAEATFPTGNGVATVVVNYSYPATIQWYTAATGGTSIGSGSPFNPVGLDPALPNTSVSGNYNYYAEAVNGSCVSTRTLAVFAVGAPLTASASAAPATPICAGTSVTLSSAFTGGGGSNTYSWKVGGTEVSTAASFSVTPAVTTTYDLTITDACFQTATASVTVTVNPLPAAVVVSGAGTFCSNATITADNGGDGTIYFQGTTSDGTSTATASVSQAISTSGTYYFRAQSAAGCWGVQGSAVVVIQTPVSITTTPASICQGGPSAALEASASCPMIYVENNTFTMANIPSTGAPTYVRSSGGTTYSSSQTVAYSTQVFRPTVTGSYVINGCASGDTHMQLYISPFTPGTPAVNFLEANDDGNTLCSSDPRITRTLTAGVDYVLVYTPFSSGVAVTGITITVTPPVGGAIQTPTGAGVLNWYADATSSTVLGTGASFDPVASGAMANTNTPGTTTYYVACSSSSACRTAVNFVITPSVVPTLNFTTTHPGEFCEGTNVTFTATTANLSGGTANYDFKVNGNSVQNGASNTYATTTLADGDTVSVDVTLSGGTCLSTNSLNGSIGVTVNPNPTITATAGPNGTISPVGVTTLPCDGSGDRTYTITPAPGYLISDLTVDGVASTSLTTGSYAAGGTYVFTDADLFTDVFVNHTINVTFALACTNSTAPTGITGITSICNGGSTTLTVQGGTMGSNAVVQWFTGSCGGTSAGTGNSITVSPTSTTTYYVRYSGDCNVTSCASVAVNVVANVTWYRDFDGDGFGDLATTTSNCTQPV
ncbi:beta strand repeat-containing protein, partial [Flavobacterium sedimenticola]